ncbi:MAG TPA: hypothetical protein VMY18_02410 [Acidobacteriota bacterium]|nr:hypothetical protein [Acidobacteriota bacterium]
MNKISKFIRHGLQLTVVTAMCLIFIGAGANEPELIEPAAVSAV